MSSGINKTQDISWMDWTDVASAAVQIGNTKTYSTNLAVKLGIKMVRRTGSAFTAGWPNLRIEANVKSTNNDFWIPVVPFQAAVGASIANTTLNGAIVAGATTCVVTAATNIAAGDILFLSDASTANYETVRVKSISGTTVTFEEACTYAHANGSLVTDQAEMYIADLVLDAGVRYRFVVDNAGSGQGMSACCFALTADSIG